MHDDPFRARLRAALASTGALLSGGHYVLNGGDHSPFYLRKEELTTRPHALDGLCAALAGRFRNERVAAVIGPAVGAITIAERVAFYLGGDVRAIWAEKRGRGFTLKRGFAELVSGARVLPVEDVMTSGGSIKRVVACVRRHGGQVVGVGALFNRGGVTAETLGVPRLETLMDLDLERWPEADCPLCRQGIQVDTLYGHGTEFLTKRGAKSR